MESSVTSGDPLLVDDDLPPDEDDFDAVDYPDPEDGELDSPPPDEGPGDQELAERDPVQPSRGDAPFNAEFPDDDPAFDLGILGPDFDGFIVPIADEPKPDDAIVRRWRTRLQVRRQLLADARAELAAAQTPAAIKAARAKVKKRKEQVAYAERIIERHRTTVTERVVRAASLALEHAALVHYTMDRPFEIEAQHGKARRWDGIRLGLRAKNGQFPRYADCSSFVTWCYWDALGGPTAGPDVINGQGWRAGFTGSQIRNGQPVPVDRARAGDLAFYDRNGSIGHVAVVVAPGRVISHGSERGPLKLALDFDGTLRQVRRYAS